MQEYINITPINKTKMRNEKIIVRKAKINDVPLILKLFSDFMKEHEKIVTQKDPALKPHIQRKNNAANIFRKFIERNIRSNKAVVDIAEVNEEIAGYSLSFIKNIPPVYNLDRIGHISDLYVKKKFRGKGISTMLKDESFRFFKRKGLKYVSIMVQRQNNDAHSIYKKWGFFDFHIDMRRKLE